MMLSVATTLPLRWCTTSIPPGSSCVVGMPEGVEHRRQHRSVGAQHRPSLGVRAGRRRARRTAFGGGVLLAEAVVVLERPARRVGVRRDGLRRSGCWWSETIRVTSYAASSGTSRCGLGSPEPQQRPEPVVAAATLAGPRLAVPEHDQRPGLLRTLARLRQRVAVVGVGEQLRGLVVRHPADLVDLVVGAVAADVVVADRPARPSRRPTSSAPPARGSAASVSGRPEPDVRRPVSSATSRTAAPSRARRGRACPWGRTSRRTSAGARAAPACPCG